MAVKSKKERKQKQAAERREQREQQFAVDVPVAPAEAQPTATVPNGPTTETATPAPVEEVPVTVAVSQSFGQCEVVPQPASKSMKIEGLGRCRNSIKTPGAIMCGIHLALARKGAELHLLSGETVNPKPAPANER